MSDTHSIDAHDAHGNRYRLTIYREIIGLSPRDASDQSAPLVPIDIIGPRGEWVSLVRPGRYLLQPLERDRAAVELFSDEPTAPEMHAFVME